MKNFMTQVTGEVRDTLTLKGTYSIGVATIAGYLTQLGLYRQELREIRLDQCMARTLPRLTTEADKDPIKDRMFRDLCRGGTLPPLVLFEHPGGERLEIIDGYLRTRVLVEVLRGLIALEGGAIPEEPARTQFSLIRGLGGSVISVGEFLDRPLVLQIWRGLEADEFVRLFIVLNAGQQRPLVNNLLSHVKPYLRAMFENWGIRLLTEEQEKLVPKRRGRKSPEAIPIPSITHFRYRSLIDGLIAHASGDLHIGAYRQAEEERVASQSNIEHAVAITSEVSKIDLIWVCLGLNTTINKKYADFPKWRSILQTSDNFLVPVITALGEARRNGLPPVTLEQHKRTLLEFVASSWHDDPLRFYTGGHESLEKVFDNVRSNIGRSQRAILRAAWLSFFQNGFWTQENPIDWSGARKPKTTVEEGRTNGN
jgi:hypothetical protein